MEHVPCLLRPCQRATDHNVCTYTRRLLKERRNALQTLEFAYLQGLVPPNDYLSCQRSLLQAIGQLETLVDEIALGCTERACGQALPN
jgi:hypothetical protein